MLWESSSDPSPAAITCTLFLPAFTRVVMSTDKPCSSSARLQPSASRTIPAVHRKASLERFLLRSLQSERLVGVDAGVLTRMENLILQGQTESLNQAFHIQYAI